MFCVKQRSSNRFFVVAGMFEGGFTVQYMHSNCTVQCKSNESEIVRYISKKASFPRYFDETIVVILSTFPAD